MLTRSGFLTKPRPLVELDWGSQSTSRVLTSAAASEAARLMAVVVLPTPPFWLAIAMMRPIGVPCVRVRIFEALGESNGGWLCKTGPMFHVKHFRLWFASKIYFGGGDPFLLLDSENGPDEGKSREVFHVKHFLSFVLNV